MIGFNYHRQVKERFNLDGMGVSLDDMEMLHTKVKALQVEGRRRGKGGPEKCLVEALHNDMVELGLSSFFVFDRAIWKVKELCSGIGGTNGLLLVVLLIDLSL